MRPKDWVVIEASIWISVERVILCPQPLLMVMPAAARSPAAVGWLAQ